MNYIALLRGVNVGGKNKLKMAELSKALVANGFDNVRTYIQSGNIVFSSTLTDKLFLADKIKEIIHKAFGLEIPVLIKTHKDLVNVVNSLPFNKKQLAETKKIYFLFLFNTPTNQILETLKAMDFHEDIFSVKDDVIYLYYNNGAGRSKMTTSIFEQKLKIVATARNWNTVHKLIDLSK